jgi:hypothetical protein
MLYNWTQYDLERFIARYLWWPLQLIASAIHPLPLLGGCALFVLFAFTSQLRELYYANAEILFSREWFAHSMLGSLALSLASAALYFTNYWFADIKIQAAYGGVIETDRWLRSVRSAVGQLAAYLPWLGVAWGFLEADSHALATLSRISEIGTSSPPFAEGLKVVVPDLEKTQAKLQYAAAVVAISGALVVLLIHALRHNDAFRSAVMTMMAFVILFLALAPISLEPTYQHYLPFASFLMPDPVVLFRAFGPIGTIALTFTAIYIFVASMARLALTINFPVLPVAFVIVTLMVLIDLKPEVIALTAACCFVIVLLLGLLSRRFELALLSVLLALLAANSARQLYGYVPAYSGPRLASEKPDQSGFAAIPRNEAAVPDVGSAFRAWLEARSVERSAFTAAGKRYPVFVVAAQGGGIYAATAAQAFLAELQARCPSFARHTFAISAVSGGAIGAAVFQSSLARTELPRAEACRERSPSSSDDPPAARIIGDDHLSPLVGSLLADFLGVVGDRARALERSLVESARRHDAGIHAMLKTSYRDHWAAGSSVPALVLNTTWSETGYRVVFAPFVPASAADETLLSFFDRRFDDVRTRSDNVVSAAVASARFPGILPAYTMPAPASSANAGRWNFVDGGYVDGSGAATAADLFQALEAVVAAKDQNFADIDLRLILLTSYRPPLDFREIKGTLAREGGAPVFTVLKVRELLTQQAVTRALAEIEGGSRASNTAASSGMPDGWKVALVELDQVTFNLPLGWRISATTRKLVTALIGAGMACPPKKSRAADSPTDTEVSGRDDGAGRGSAEKPEISASRILGNACVIQAISALLQPPAPPP